MKPSAVLIAAALVAVGCAAEPRATCVYDEAALLELDYQAFDQDLAPGGWRAIADIPECRGIAADLIARWREAHISELEEDERAILFLHQGQVLAADGNYAAALPAFEQSYRDPSKEAPPPETSAEDMAAWRAMMEVSNAFVDAHIAFVKRDRPALEAAHKRLAAVPEPPGYDKLEVPPGIPREAFSWPLNLDDVDRMLACFDASYGVDCRKNSP